MQDMEVIKLLADMGGSLKGKLMVCDFRDMFFTTIEVLKRPHCPVCGRGKPVIPMNKGEGLAVLCGRNTVNMNPSKPIHESLAQLYKRLENRFKILVKSSFVIVFEYNGGIEVSLFNGGRMLIKNVKDEEAALRVHNAVFKAMGFEKNTLTK